MVMNKTAPAKKKPAAAPTARGLQQIAAGEFKAKCLKIMDEINKTGKSMIVTKRGVPVMKVVPIREVKVQGEKDPIFGRLKGLVEIEIGRAHV